MRPCSCKKQLKMGELHAHEDDSHEDEDNSHQDEDNSHEDEDGWSNRATYGSNEHIVGMI